MFAYVTTCPSSRMKDAVDGELVRIHECVERRDEPTRYPHDPSHAFLSIRIILGYGYETPRMADETPYQWRTHHRERWRRICAHEGIRGRRQRMGSMTTLTSRKQNNKLS